MVRVFALFRERPLLLADRLKSVLSPGTFKVAIESTLLFTLLVAILLSCSTLVFNLDGREADEGAAGAVVFELGRAFVDDVEAFEGE